MQPCPSIESFLKLGQKVPITFYLFKGPIFYSNQVRLDTTIGNIKEQLSCVVKIPAEHIELWRKGILLQDGNTVEDIGGAPSKTLSLTIGVAQSAQDQFSLPKGPQLPPAEPITKQVAVKDGKGRSRKVALSIVYASTKKPYLGGYRNKVTNAESHHATTQTPGKKISYRQSQAHKASQAFREADISIQTLTTTYTQVDRRDYFYSTCRPRRYVMPRPYRSAEQWAKRRIKAAVTIQRYWRRWLAVRERKRRLQALVGRVEWAESLRKGRTEARSAMKEEELYRQQNPTTLMDVELLYRAINTWKQEQIDYVVKNRWGAEKKAALADIMEKEADLLLGLERAKAQIIRRLTQRRMDKVFAKMGSPRRILTSTGKFVLVDTQTKGMARNLHETYLKLGQFDGQEPVERLEILEDVYAMVKGTEITAAHYLLQLIGREVSLIQLQSRHKLLPQLRKRICLAFFKLCTDFRFNPEAEVLQKIPLDEKKLRKDMLQCKGCKRMMYRDQFAISNGVNVTGKCKFCNNLYTTGVLRVDLNLYRQMLDELRKDEQNYGVQNSIAYLLQPSDMQFLVKQLWHGQSVLSGISDVYALRLCRWRKDEAWSPWNCVLLTEEEAVAHLAIQDLGAAYQPSFFQKVALRHNTARSYFARTDEISNKFLAIPPANKCAIRTCP